jgi:hypothetical protein
MRALYAVPFLAASLAGCAASVRNMDVSHLPTYTIDAVNAAPDETVGKALQSGPKAVVVLFKKGDKVPLHLRAAFGPIAIEPGDDHVVFAQDIYMYITLDGSPEFMLLSPDGKRWAAVQDHKALAKLFGLKTGTFQIGFGVNKERGAAFTIAVERK